MSDVGVVERRQKLRFPLEAEHTVRIGGKRGGQHFDGDFAVKLRIHRAVDGAHAAFAELAGDLVVGDGIRRVHWNESLYRVFV